METMPVKEREKLQLKRLKWVVARCAKNPFYKKRFKEAGFAPAQLKKISDLSKIPFTYKTDLRDTYPFGMFTEPLQKITEVHASSGTTGKPIVVGYTKNDIENVWAEVMARAYTAAGATSKDVIQNAYGYGLFTGGLGFHYGALKIGATVIPVATGNTERQIMLMQDFGTTVLCCTPSYSLYLYSVIESSKTDMSKIKLKCGLFGAEPWSNNMRKEIESRMHIKAYDMYGLSEVIGPGVAAECEKQNGLHVYDDHFIPEIIDSKTGEVLGPEEEGELVFTTITKEGFPVLRYRTKDISKLYVDKCACGRTHPRIERISGRADDMLIIRGINVFPSQIESVVLEMPELEPFYQITVDRVNNLDTLAVEIELGQKAFEKKAELEPALKKRLSDRLESVLQIKADLTLAAPGTLPRSEGKAKRVIDKRKM
ncbi:MAG: phenylacetate--CoA ligase [Candidatus Diapherotrites archaeon]|nr:phenylacetate--CoA ligase [Candidatus Diapherotrites archaeon]